MNHQISQRDSIGITQRDKFYPVAADGASGNGIKNPFRGFIPSRCDRAEKPVEKSHRDKFGHLERAAIDAHAAGMTWRDFWQTVASDVVAAEPHDVRRFHRLVPRLTALMAAGDGCRWALRSLRPS